MRYAVVFFNTEIYLADELAHALAVAKEHVDQYICDHFDYELPFNVSTLKRFDPEVEIFCLDSANSIDVPLQDWVDLYYKQMKEYEEELKENEYKTYLVLKEKYEGKKL